MRMIGHLDMDAFFAAVEELDKPHLRGRPIVVGADPKDGHGRGVVATANYAARHYGIRSAMPIQTAWRCAEEGRRAGGQEVAWVFPRGERYGEVSEKIMRLIGRHVPVHEQASVDEAYLDLSFTGSFGAARDVAKKLKMDIREGCGLTASIGIGPNRLIAKIASDREKPDGLTVVGDDDPEQCDKLVQDFLGPLQVRAIPGIGPKAEAILVRRGISTIRELQQRSPEELTDMFGVRGEEMYERARGRDESPVGIYQEAKSVGSQMTFRTDLNDPRDLTRAMQSLCGDVYAQFRANFSTFRRVVVTVRFADFETHTRSHMLKEPERTLETFEFQAMLLLLPFLDMRSNPKKKKMRLLGARLEKLA